MKYNVPLFCLVSIGVTAAAFQSVPAAHRSALPQRKNTYPSIDLRLKAETDISKPKITASAVDVTPKIEIASVENLPEVTVNDGEEKAAVGTVNERLQAELRQASDNEKNGSSSAFSKKLGLEAFRSSKTDAEREAAIAEARNLNGVNPVVALTGGLFAFAVAFGLWTGTQAIAEFFAFNPVDTDVYFIARTAAVFRNVVIGLVSLAAGFFGVTGLGIFLLGVRVAVGVAKGELDPTPLRKKEKSQDELDLKNVWDLMLNKKPGRRR